MTTGVQVSTAGDQDIILTRVFNAPRHLVFDAWTKPELIKRWLIGPDGWTMPVCTVDLRVGGAFRYEWQNGDGARMGMSGVYNEIAHPDRLVSRQKFDEAWYPGEETSFLDLVEENGRTTAINTMRYDSKEARDLVMQTPMQEGYGAGCDRMEALLAELRAVAEVASH